MRVRRGEIYLAKLDPVVGHEQGGIRPVLILQNERGNKYSPTTIVACITSKAYKKASLPTHYYISDRVNMPYKSLVLLEQVRTIDKKRLLCKVGRLTKREMLSIDHRIVISLNLENYVKNRIEKHYK